MTTQLEIIDACNLACKPCFNRRHLKRNQDPNGSIQTSRTLSLDVMLKALEKDDDKELLIGGGEPFMHPDITEICATLVDSGAKLVISTNGTYIPDSFLDLPAKYKPAIKVQVSYFAATPETFAAQSQADPNLHTNQVINIDRLAAAGFFIYFNCCVTPDNIHELNEMARFALDHNSFIRFYPDWPNLTDRQKWKISYTTRIFNGHASRPVVFAEPEHSDGVAPTYVAPWKHNGHPLYANK